MPLDAESGPALGTLNIFAEKWVKKQGRKGGLGQMADVGRTMVIHIAAINTSYWHDKKGTAIVL
jgi:hypothetical protein